MLPDRLWQLRPPPPPPPLSSSVLHLLVLLSLHAARAPRSRLSASQQRLERSRAGKTRFNSPSRGQSWLPPWVPVAERWFKPPQSVLGRGGVHMSWKTKELVSRL